MDTEARKLYHEYFALELLKSYDPSFFQNFIKDEEPDLQDSAHNRGIEVTLLTHNESKRADLEFEKYCHPSSDSMKNNSKKTIESLGRTVDTCAGIHCMTEGGGYNGCRAEFIELIEKKLKKIDNYRKKFSDVSLFIEADALCYNDLNSFSSWIKSCQSKFKKQFDRYYIYFGMRRRLFLYQNGVLSEVYSIEKEKEIRLKEYAMDCIKNKIR